MPVFYMGICLIGILWFHRFPRLNYTPLLQTLTNCLFKPLLHMASLSIISDVGFCFQIFLKLVFLLGSTLHFCLVFPWTKKTRKWLTTWNCFFLQVLAWLLRHDGFQNVYAFVYGTPQVAMGGHGAGRCVDVSCFGWCACLELDEHLAEYVGEFWY